MASNKYRGEIELDLDGNKRMWCLTWKDISEIENALDQLNGKKTSWQKFIRSMEDWTIDDYALVLWAGLRRSDPALTCDRIKELASMPMLNEFSFEFGEVMAASIPDKYKKKYGDLMNPPSQTASGT